MLSLTGISSESKQAMALEIVLQYSMTTPAFTVSLSTLEKQVAALHEKMIELSRSPVVEGWRKDQLSFDDTMATDIVKEVLELDVDEALSCLTAVEDTDDKASLVYAENEQQPASTEEQAIPIFKAKDLFTEFKRMYDKFWFPISLSQQHLVIAMALELSDVYQELQLAVASFFRRQRECHRGHVCNVLVYQMTGHMVWKDRMSVFEKVIYALALNAGLIEAERMQFSLSSLRGFDWTTFCRTHYAKNHKYCYLFSRGFTRGCIVEFKTSLLTQIEERIQSNIWILMKTVHEKMIKHWKSIGFDLMQCTQSLFSLSVRQTSLRAPIPVQTRIRLSRLKRQLNEDSKSAECVNELTSAGRKIMAWLLKTPFNDKDNLFDLCLTLSSHEQVLQRMRTTPANKELLDKLQEIRWESDFFLFLHLSTMYCTFMSIYPNTDNVYTERYRCEEVSQLLALQHLLLTVQYVLPNTSSISPSTVLNVETQITSMLKQMHPILRVSIQSMAIARRECHWQFTSYDAEGYLIDSGEETFSYLWIFIRSVHEDLVASGFRLAIAMRDYIAQTWYCCRLNFQGIFSYDNSDEIDWEIENQWRDILALCVSQCEVMLDTKKQYLQHVLAWDIESLDKEDMFVVSKQDLIYDFPLISYFSLLSKRSLTPRHLSLWRIRLEEGLCVMLDNAATFKKIKVYAPTFVPLITELFQCGIDLWREVLACFDNPSLAMESLEEMTMSQVMAQLHFSLICELQDVMILVKQKENDRLSDDVIRCIKMWHMSGRESFGKWRCSSKHERGQQLLLKCHLMHILLGIGYGMHFKDNPTLLPIENHCFAWHLRRRVDRPIEYVERWNLVKVILQEIQESSASTIERETTIEKLSWLEKLLSCMSMNEEMEGYLCHYDKVRWEVHDNGPRLRKEIVEPCIHLLEWICRNYSKSHQTIFLSRHIISFAAQPYQLDYELIAETLEQEISTVLEGYLRNQRSTEIPFEKQTAINRLTMIAMQTRDSVFIFY